MNLFNVMGRRDVNGLGFVEHSTSKTRTLSEKILLIFLKLH